MAFRGQPDSDHCILLLFLDLMLGWRPRPMQLYGNVDIVAVVVLLERMGGGGEGVRVNPSPTTPLLTLIPMNITFCFDN